jgi:hypothetical protein
VDRSLQPLGSLLLIYWNKNFFEKEDRNMAWHQFKWASKTLGILAFAGLLPCLAYGQATVTEFRGTATDIGIQRGPGQTGGVEFRVYGTFVYPGTINLAAATARFDALLAELGPGGQGELLTTVDDAPLVPITLVTRSGGKPDEAVYETPGRFRPQFRFSVQTRFPKSGIFEFALKVDRALARQRPKLCVVDPKDKRSKSDMTISFTLDDHVNPPLVLTTTQPWECTKPDRYHMRAR